MSFWRKLICWIYHNQYEQAKRNSGICLICAAILAGVTDAHAQQNQPDLKFIQEALTVVQQQRNQAFDALAAIQAKLGQTQAELDKLKKEQSDAQQKPSASPDDGSSRSQPKVRK